VSWKYYIKVVRIFILFYMYSFFPLDFNQTLGLYILSSVFVLLQNKGCSN
jgi:hypothetical protein